MSPIVGSHRVDFSQNKVVSQWTWLVLIAKPVHRPRQAKVSNVVEMVGILLHEIGKTFSFRSKSWKAVVYLIVFPLL